MTTPTLRTIPVRCRAVLPALALLVTTACHLHGGAAGPKQPPAPAAPADVLETLKGSIEQYRQAYEIRSLDALAPLYAQNDDLVVSAQGHTLRGWAAVQADISSFLANHATVKLKFTPPQITALGDGG